MNIKALLVGINEYQDPDVAPLLGCENDVLRMKDLLRGRYRVPEANVRTLINQEATTRAIVEGINWLAAREADGERTCLFHYSGHGAFTLDTSGDEKDRRDEGLCPHEYTRANGLLVDDRLRELYGAFDRRTHLVLIMDSCHSGTVQKPPNKPTITWRFVPQPKEVIRAVRQAEREERARRDEAVEAMVREELMGLGKSLRSMSEEEVESLVKRITRRARSRYDRAAYGFENTTGNRVLLAACKDSEQSADYPDFPEGPQGAMTYFLLRALKDGGPLSYRDLVARLSEEMYNYDEAFFAQTPQLACSRTLRTRPFLGVAE